MTDIQFSDAVPVSGLVLNDHGYMVGEAFVARSGVQLYKGSEVGMPEKQVVRVYRDEAEIRKPESMRTFAHAPITIGHPKELVTSDNWDRYAVGEVSTEAEWKDNKIKLPLILKAARGVKAIQDGMREVSMGYLSKVDPTPGYTADGVFYDAKQIDIRINHLAFVPAGRAGPECRLLDEASIDWGAAPIATNDKQEVSMSLKTVVLGDAAVEVAVADAETVKNFFAKLTKDHADTVETLTKDHDAALGKAAGENAALQEQVAALQAQVMTDAQISERAEARAKMIAVCDRLAPGLDLKALNDADMRRAVITKRFGDAATKDKSDDYVMGIFDSLAQADTKRQPDPAVVPSHRPLRPQATNDAAHDPTYGQMAFVDNLTTAWMNPGATTKEV